MKKITQLFILLSLGSFIIYSCSSEYSGYKKTESGIYYKFYVESDSEKINAGDEATFNLRYTINDSVFFDTKGNPYPNKKIIPNSGFPGDLYECFTLMSVGDSASFIIEADSFFLKTINQAVLPKFVKPNSKLYVDIYIQDNKTKEELKLENEKNMLALKAKENELIEKFKTEQNINQEAIENTGIFFKSLKKGSGQYVQPNDFVTLEYSINSLSGRVVFDSESFGKELVLECMGDNYEAEGFNLALTKMRKGDKISFLIPSKMAFGENGIRGRIQPFEPLNYTIEVLKIQKNDEYLLIKETKDRGSIDAEIEKISTYIKDNNITESPRKSGLYFIENKEGEGDFAKKGDKVRVHYSLYTLDGEKIDSSHDRNETFSFVIDKGQVIAGWNEALMLMKEGGKATLIIPSKIAYKDRKRSEVILPYTPLLFEVELVEIVK